MGDRVVPDGGDRLRARLDAGGPVVGTFLQIAREPATVILLAQAGLDFVVVDLEHGAFDLPTVQRLCLTARLAGITPLVRTPDDPAVALDAGAVGVLAPHVDDTETARRIVASTRFPPSGHRSVSSYNAHVLFRPLPLAEVVETVGKQTYVAVQVESAAAVECAGRLASTPGVDALFVGPGDLAVDLGVVGQPDDATLSDAIGRVIDAGREAGVPVGIHVPDTDAAGRWLERGATIVSVSTDARLLQDGARAVAALRS